MRAGITQKRLIASFVCWALTLAAVPAALAFSPPSPTSPAADSKSTEGEDISFTWDGALQGDTDALSRSFFRVELAPIGDIPSDVQAAWTTLTNFVITQQGAAQNAVVMGVPSAGSYKWRVCAWGVVDESVSTALTQLPGGCSSSRSIAVSALAADEQIPSEVIVKDPHTVQEPNTTIRRPSSSGNPTGPSEKIIDLPSKDDPAGPAAFDTPKPNSDAAGALTDKGTRKSSVGNIGGKGTSFGSEGGGRPDTGAFAAVGHALSFSVPGVPIPFWSLGLLLLALPLAWAWNRSTLAMFDWGDDGSLEILDIPLDERDIKDFEPAADGSEAHPHQPRTEAPPRGTMAA